MVHDCSEKFDKSVLVVNQLLFNAFRHDVEQLHLRQSGSMEFLGHYLLESNRFVEFVHNLEGYDLVY